MKEREKKREGERDDVRWLRLRCSIDETSILIPVCL